MSLRLDWLVGGQHAPYFVAREKGYYREAGLDVDILEAQGSNQALELVGNKSATFANADGGAAIKAVSQDLPIKTVSAFNRISPLGFSSLKATGIKTPKDLEGKNYGQVTGAASAALWPAFAKINNISVDKVKVTNISAASADRLILAGQVDFTDGTAGGEAVRYTAAGKEGAFLGFAENGLIVVGYGMVTNNDVIRDKADVVRSFVKATLHGLDDARKDPQAAVDILVKAAPNMQQVRRQQALSGLEGSLAAIDSPNSQGKPLGWMAEKDWDSTISALVLSGGLPKAVDPKNVFTNDFLPSS